jgi:hypothetical protein
MMHDRPDLTVAFVGTATTAADLAEFIPPSNIHANGLDSEKDKAKFNKFVNEIFQHGDEIRKTPRKILVIMDDITNKNALRQQAVTDMFKKGRHVQIMVIVCIQKLTDLLPEYRENADWVIVTGFPSDKAGKQITENFGKGEPKHFQQILEQVIYGSSTVKRFAAIKNIGGNARDALSSVYAGVIENADNLPAIPRLSAKLKFPLACATANSLSKKFYRTGSSGVKIDDEVMNLPPALQQAINKHGPQHQQVPPPIGEEEDDESEIDDHRAIIYTGVGRNKTSSGIVLEFDDEVLKDATAKFVAPVHQHPIQVIPPHQVVHHDHRHSQRPTEFSGRAGSKPVDVSSRPGNKPLLLSNIQGLSAIGDDGGGMPIFSNVNALGANNQSRQYYGSSINF